MCVRLTVVFLFKEGPQLVGSLLGRVLVLRELALLLLRDQLKYRLGRSGTQTKGYKCESLCLFSKTIWEVYVCCCILA